MSKPDNELAEPSAEQLASRLAQEDVGYDDWSKSSAVFQDLVTSHWRKYIEVIRRTGLRVVEARQPAEEKLAELFAHAEWQSGGLRLSLAPADVQHRQVAAWQRRIRAIRSAGLEIIEAED